MTELRSVDPRPTGTGSRRGVTILATVASILLAGCAGPPVAKAYGEELTKCAENEVLACDSASRIRDVQRLCSCQPERQTLNAEINR